MNYHVQHSFTRPSYESLRIAQIEQEQRARSALNSISDPYERLQEKRRQYACTGSRYVTFLDIPSLDAAAFLPRPPHPPNSPNTNVNLRNKISLFQGDITTLEVDAIVNAANTSLLGGGGIDGAIHIAAGVLLREECAPLKGCPTGYTKITLGCRLPAHYVLHTVGPDDGNPDALRHCYLTLLDHVVASHDQPQPASRVSSISTTSPSFQVSHYYAPPPPPTPYSPTTFRYHRSIRTLAICAIAVGIYGFPLEEATHIALGSIRKWLNVHHSLVDRIVFVVSEERVKVAYETLLPAYF